MGRRNKEHCQEKTKERDNSLLTRGRLAWKQPKDLLQQRHVSLAVAASQYCSEVNVTKLVEVDYRAKLYSVDRLTTNRLDLTLFF